MPLYPKFVESEHWLAFKTNDRVGTQDVYFVSVSGVAHIEYKGNSGSWFTNDVTIHVNLPVWDIPVPPPPDEGTDMMHNPIFKSKNWVVYASLNSIYNHSRAINSGHAVNNFKLHNPHHLSNGLAKIGIRVSVSDRDAYLYRVGFKADLLVYFSHYYSHPA